MRRDRHNRAATGAAVVLALAAAVALPASGQTMVEAMVLAYNSNPDLLAARARLRVVDEGVSQAMAGWRPTVSVTGQYGYVSENGAQGSVVPGEIGFWDPFGNASNITRVRSLPLDLATTEATFGADWKLGGRNTLGATYAFNRFEPSNRERSEVDSHSLKLTWVNRAADWLITTTRNTPDEQILGMYTFFSHVANSLSLWRKTHPCDFWAKYETENAPVSAAAVVGER